jgi:hypothetical protein
MNLAFGFVYVLDRDRHSPLLSKGSGLGVNFLASRSWAFGHNRARLGIPPESIISGFGEETPNVLYRGVYGGKGADANAHSLICLSGTEVSVNPPWRHMRGRTQGGENANANKLSCYDSRIVSIVVRADAGAKSLDRSKSEILQSLIEGRHVGLDAYDLLTEALRGHCPNWQRPRPIAPLGIGRSSAGLANLRVSGTAERLAYGDAEVRAARVAANIRGFVTTLANFNPPSFGCDSDV